ncbi:RelE family toxin-antitoxin system [Klebsiella pneumoniae]|nr:RelE family toxin-antitoxin system [Klebsiella pneumoniae]
MTDITELALIAKIKKQLENFDTVVLKEAEAKALVEALESSCIAPGILRCTECSFVLTKNIISVTADTITTVESESEPCPNGCGQLQLVTWKALAIQLMFTTKQGLSDLLLPDLRQVVSGDRYVWSDGVFNYSQDVKAELTAKGIKWEAE